MVHAVEADEPLYFPAAHTEQATDSTPVAALVRYFPAAQLEHVVVAAPLYCPAPQSVQAMDSTLVAALVRYFAAVQLEHAVDADPLYRPGLQSVQAEDSSPVAELVRYFPGEQLEHEVGPSEPSSENLPASQSKHGPELLYFPAEHDKLQVPKLKLFSGPFISPIHKYSVALKPEPFVGFPVQLGGQVERIVTSPPLSVAMSLPRMLALLSANVVV